MHLVKENTVYSKQKLGLLKAFLAFKKLLVKLKKNIVKKKN